MTAACVSAAEAADGDAAAATPSPLCHFGSVLDAATATDDDVAAAFGELAAGGDRAVPRAEVALSEAAYEGLVLFDAALARVRYVVRVRWDRHPAGAGAAPSGAPSGTSARTSGGEEEGGEDHERGMEQEEEPATQAAAAAAAATGDAAAADDGDVDHLFGAPAAAAAEGGDSGGGGSVRGETAYSVRPSAALDDDFFDEE